MNPKLMATTTTIRTIAAVALYQTNQSTSLREERLERPFAIPSSTYKGRGLEPERAQAVCLVWISLTGMSLGLLCLDTVHHRWSLPVNCRTLVNYAL